MAVAMVMARVSEFAITLVILTMTTTRADPPVDLAQSVACEQEDCHSSGAEAPILTQMFHQPLDHTLRLAKHEEVVSPREEKRRSNDAMVVHSARQLEALSAPARQTPDDEGFDCYAGLDNWEMGWSDIKKDWCCQTAGLGCKVEKRAGPIEKPKAEVAPASTEGAGTTVKAPPASPEGAGKTEKVPASPEGADKTEKVQAEVPISTLLPTTTTPPTAVTTAATLPTMNSNTCVTVEDARASHPFYQTSPPGTPCIFGVDADDEGSHCIYDGGRYGSFGWCFTSLDRSTWGSCGSACPFSGYQKLLADKLDNLTQTLSKQQCSGCGANKDNKAANGTDVDMTSSES
jgi:hypothetical protein